MSFTGKVHLRYLALTLTMNITQLLTLLLPTYRPQSGEVTKEVLRDFPGCGQLGDPEKKECFWGCNWEPSPLEGIKGDLGKIELLIGAKIQSLGMCQVSVF